jgi:hypothetical protein
MYDILNITGFKWLQLFHHTQDVYFKLFTVIHSTLNNFMDWPHSGAVMNYSRYVEPQDGTVSVLFSSQQEDACVHASGVFRKSLLSKVVVSRMSQFQQGKTANSAKNLQIC